MITGFSPSYKKIVIGDDEITMPGDKIVKFKRASTATYINKSGVLTNAAIDEPRFEKDGLLIEGQRTNYFVNSNNPESWNPNPRLERGETKTDARGFKYATFKPGEYLGGAGSYTIIAGLTTNKIAVVNGDGVTISFRAKGKNVRFAARFDKGDPLSSVASAIIDCDNLGVATSGVDAKNIVLKNATIDGEWIFAEIVYKVTDESTSIRGVIQVVNKQGEVFDENSFMDLTTPQVEVGSCASSFIITNESPTTRASDMVTLPIKNNLYNLPFTVLVEAHKNWSITPNAAPRVFDTGGHQSGAAIILAFRSAEGDADGFPYCDIGKSNRRVNENAKLKKMIIGMRVKSDYNTCCVSNARISSETKTEWRYIVSTATIRIGGQTSTGERHLFGHVRNFRIWHKALTDHQLGEIV